MAHFALLDENNIVVEVLVGRKEDDGKEEELCQRTGHKYKQTSYNTYGGKHLLGGVPFRKNYAGIGFLYDEQRDAFIPPKPEEYQSWVLDEEMCLWVAPVPLPDDVNVYQWVEETLSWKYIRPKD